eukprot:gene19193-21830_t
MCEEYAQVLHKRILDHPKASCSNSALSAFGLGLCRALPRLPNEEIVKVCKGEGNLEHLVEQYQKTLGASAAVFDAITSHHRAISKEEWTDVAADQASLAKYSEAASAMGTRKWVMDCNEWMETFAVGYFKHGTARKHYVKEYQAKHNLSRNDTVLKELLNSLPKDLTTVDSPYGNRIKLLDVGSCYNPIGRSNNDASLDVTALDLYPADPSVFQADFLNLAIGAKDSQPLIEASYSSSHPSGSAATSPVPGKESQRLLSLPEGSFDVVTMSLVLNYLPSPEQRLAMIRKARQLLRSPPLQSAPNSNSTYSTSDINTPHRTGLLLIAEKESIFANSDHAIESVGQNKMALLSGWKQAIANEGFSLVKYQLLHSGPKRASHVFAFATINPADSVTGTLNAIASEGKEQPKLWIRQDFDVMPDDARSTAEDGEDDIQERLKRYRVSIAGRRPIGIVGGGIGGSALALSLQHKNIPYVVFEKDASFDTRKQGYALTMQQGGPALRALGLGDLLQTIGTVSTNHSSFRWDGARLGTYGLTKRMPSIPSVVLANKKSKDPFRAVSEDLPVDNTEESGQEVLLKARDRHNVHVPRQKLREILMQKIDPTNVQWNKKLRSIDVITGKEETAAVSESAIETHGESGHFVRVSFEDGSSAEVSALIGADGIYSTVRSRLEALLQNSTAGDSTISSLTPAPSPNKLKYLGLMVILGIAPNEGSPQNMTESSEAAAFTTRVQCQWLDGETRVFSMPYDANHTMWQLSFPCEEQIAQQLSGLPLTVTSTQSGSSVTATGPGSNTTEDSRRSAVSICLKEEALKRCAGWDPKLIALLSRADPSLVSGHPVYDRDPDALNCLPTENNQGGRKQDNDGGDAEGTKQTPSDWPVTLLGDAAHPMSPFKGQG